MAGAVPTASPPVLAPGTAAAHFNYEVWEESVDPATYQKMLLTPRCSQTRRPYSLGRISKFARLTGNALSSTASGLADTLLYENPDGGEASLTPGTNYVATARQFGEEVMNPYNLSAELASEMENALAELTEVGVAANIATLTQFRGGPTVNITAAELRNAMSLLGRNTNGQYSPGDAAIYGILDWSQHAHLMSIPEFTNAEIRGDKENPQVKGIWDKGAGIMMMLSTALTTDVNGTHGCIWVPTAFGVGWNARTQVLRQDDGLQKQIVVANNLGSTVRQDLRGIGLRTDNTIPA